MYFPWKTRRFHTNLKDQRPNLINFGGGRKIKNEWCVNFPLFDNISYLTDKIVLFCDHLARTYLFFISFPEKYQNAEKNALLWNYFRRLHAHLWMFSMWKIAYREFSDMIQNRKCCVLRATHVSFLFFYVKPIKSGLEC